jgi:hypothetical protein
MTVSAHPVYGVHIGDQNNAVAMSIDPAWLASRRKRWLRKAWQAKPIYAVVILKIALENLCNKLISRDR